jgi:acyl carrier protein
VARQDFEEAMEAASDCMEIYKQLGRKKEQAESMSSVANIYVQMGDVDEAVETIEETMVLAQEVNAPALQARLQLLLAQAYVTIMSRADLPGGKRAALPADFLEARQKATRATKNALGLAGKCGDKRVRASALFWHAEVLVWTFRGGEALHFAQEAEQQFASCNDKRGQAYSTVLMADLNLMVGTRADAQQTAEKALSIIDGLPGMEDIEASAKKVIQKAQKKEVVPVVAVPVDGPVEAIPAIAAAKTQQSKPTLSKDFVKAKVLELAGTVVIDDDAIEQDVPFMEAGLDSLGSVQFVTDVSTAFGIQLPPSAIFDYPTGRALIDHIIGETS